MTGTITSILISVLVSIVVTLITLFVFQPIQGQKQLIGEIAYATRYYRTATSKVRAEWRDREAARAKAEEATEALLMLSARLGASPATFPARGSPTGSSNPLIWSHRGRALVKPLVSLGRGRIG